ncbi:MAG: RAMP superfamily CRISPR-associated protein, partial [Planctomycetota bacterium]|nr:RAMP superfamily CRISPR-associated protein [Planctomycetota bacterium]
MTELQRGTLKVTLRKGKPPLVQVDIDGKLFTPTQGQLSSNLTLTHGMEIEFERVGGQPKQVRAVGQTFVAQATESSRGNTRTAQGETSKQHQSGTTGGQHSPQSQAQPSGEQIRQDQHQRDFHNPYSFVPAPPRKTDDSELGNGPPVPHDAFDPKRYSGRIRVRMVVKTPVLVPDTDPANIQEGKNGHKTFRLRVDENGLPSIPASSIRGMLRSAFEATTNSRFGRFSSGHKTKIQYRETQKPFRKVDFPASPKDLLHPTLRPATSIDKLSPADRVFGWVRADADSPSGGNRSDRVAVRGCLRVGPILCESELLVAVETFAHPGIPLAILAAPKPQQGRFYVAESPNGEAQQDGLGKVEAGYSNGKGLRGRKVYPHQH